MSTKRCSKCGEEKPLSAFGKHNQKRDGLRPDCKVCVCAFHKARREGPLGAGIKARKKAAWARNLEANHARQRAYYEAHKERVKAKARQYEAEHKEEVRERKKGYLLRNPDKTGAAWYRANPERRTAYQRANAAKLNFRTASRRAAKRLRTVRWADQKAIEEVYAFAAEFRGVGMRVEVDHVIPLQGHLVSGLHVENNLRVVLMQSNRKKGNRFDEATHLA